MDETTDKQGQNGWQRFVTRISNRYRLSVMNEETFEEVRSFQLSLLSVYAALCTIIVLVAIGMFILFAYTPAREYLIDTNSYVEEEQLIALHQELTELENVLAAQATYAESFRNLLLGEFKATYDEEQMLLDSAQLERITPPEEVALSAEEIRLRREMDLESLGEAVREGNNAVVSGSQDVPLEQIFFVAPVSGEISAQFDLEGKHLGVDIIAPKGTAVKAALDGYVIVSDYTYNTGYTIGVQHSNGVVTFYKHNTELLKDIGSFVKSGEAIAIIGNTGHQTTGPHLHFELWRNGQPVDPVEYIKF
ncbi:MAG: peptidoglycan DD-metalloendopeptidase family protein [Bacteroidota bacterium]